MSAATSQWASPLLFAGLFAALWLAVTWLLSHTSGWVALARIYRADEAAAGIPVRISAARMGHGLLGQFRNVLTAWVSARGLHLHMQFLFRINSRDLLFPWADISVSRSRQFFIDYVELKFRRAPEIPLRIYGRAAALVQEAAGSDWPERKA